MLHSCQDEMQSNLYDSAISKNKIRQSRQETDRVDNRQTEQCASSERKITSIVIRDNELTAYKKQKQQVLTTPVSYNALPQNNYYKIRNQ